MYNKSMNILKWKKKEIEKISSTQTIPSSVHMYMYYTLFKIYNAFWFKVDRDKMKIQWDPAS